MTDLIRFDAKQIGRILLYVGLFYILFAATFGELFSSWELFDQAYAHGYLIFIAYFYFAAHYSKAQKPTSSVAWQYSYYGIIVLVSCSWALFKSLGIGTGAQLALLALVWWITSASTSTKPSFHNILAGFLLFLTVPIWGILETTLRDLASLVVGDWLKIVGIPVLIEGYFITIESGTFYIAGGCSGLSFLLATLSFGTCYSLLNRVNASASLLIVVTCVAVGLACNWLRIFTIVLCGHIYEMDHFLIQTDHYWFGWALNAVSMTLLFVVFNKAKFVSEVDRQPATTAVNSPSALPIFVLLLATCGPLISTVVETRSESASRLFLEQVSSKLTVLGYRSKEENMNNIVHFERPPYHIRIDSYPIHRQGNELAMHELAPARGRAITKEQCIIIADRQADPNVMILENLFFSFVSDFRVDSHLVTITRDCEGIVCPSAARSTLQDTLASELPGVCDRKFVGSVDVS